VPPGCSVGSLRGRATADRHDAGGIQGAAGGGHPLGQPPCGIGCRGNVRGAQDTERRRDRRGVVGRVIAVHVTAPGVRVALGTRRQRVDRFSESFFSFLWKRPDIRKRWVLRHRNEPAVREVAFEVADNLRQIIPTDALGPTLRHAVMEDFTTSLRSQGRRGGELKAFDLTLSVPLAKMLSWFIQHFPTSAQWYIGEIMGEADKQLGIPAQVTGEALRRSATTNGNLDGQAAREFFSRVVPQETEN
jgi:hypothetical protein